MEAKSESPSAAILKLEGLNLHYADKHVLKNINMDIQPHSITALIGPSGCGKSSLLRCLNRMNDLIETTAIDGKIMYCGYEIDINSRKLDVTQLRQQNRHGVSEAEPFSLRQFMKTLHTACALRAGYLSLSSTTGSKRR
jgi:phosphate transport system ATP-binding protein